jgi:hypothetical protein
MTTHLAIVADLHVNSTVAICPPRIEKDEGTHLATREQRWLGECFRDYCTGFYQLPGRHVVIINGDVGELDTKKRSLQLISTNKATIQRIILETIEPLIGDADAVYVMRGTSAHTGKSAWLEEWLGNDIDAIGPSNDTRSWWNLRTDCEGVRLDIAHHASMSASKAGKLGAPSRLACETWSDYTEAGNKPPNLVIRSHNHRSADTFDNFPVRVIYTGAWTFATEYIYRSGKYTANMLADISGLYLTCEDGKIEVERKAYKPERRNVWALKM